MRQVTKREKAIPFVLCVLFVIPIILDLAGISIVLAENISFAVPSAAVNLIVTAIIVYGATAVTFLSRHEIHGLVSAMYYVALALSAVFAIYNGILADSVVLVVISFSVFFCCFVSCIVILPRAKHRVIFVIASAVPVLIVAPVISLISFITLNSIGTDTVRGTYTSPEGTYRIEVIDSDQGALGGDTVVVVYYEKPIVHLGIVKIMKDPESLYIGDWKEDIRISWVDDDTVVINGEVRELN